MEVLKTIGYLVFLYFITAFVVDGIYYVYFKIKTKVKGKQKAERQYKLYINGSYMGISTMSEARYTYDSTENQGRTKSMTVIGNTINVTFK